LQSKDRNFNGLLGGVKNVLEIGQAVTEIWRFLDFQDGVRRTFFIFKVQNFNGRLRGESQYASFAKFRGDRSNRCQDIAI